MPLASPLLNLGHSFGHAVEACSGFTVLHGQAVSIGIAAICRAAAAKGCCSQEEIELSQPRHVIKVNDFGKNGENLMWLFSPKPRG